MTLRSDGIGTGDAPDNPPAPISAAALAELRRKNFPGDENHSDDMPTADELTAARQFAEAQKENRH